MRTKHLIIGLILIVAIFVGKGFFVTQDVREASDKNFQEFQTLTEIVYALRENYGTNMMVMHVKAAHGIISTVDLAASLKNARATERVLLNNYATLLKSHESIDDRELFIRSNDVGSYVDKVLVLCELGDDNEIHQVLYSGEIYSVFDPMYRTLDRIADAKLKAAADYRTMVEKTLSNFDRVMMFSGTLVFILGVAVVRLPKSGSTNKKIRHRARKNTLKTRTAT